MSKRTALNEGYKGLVEAVSVPAAVLERDGKKYATFGSVVPIHCCTQEEVLEHAAKTHHYCDLFTEQLLAPLAELAFVRLDENTAEKVFINRSKRLLLASSDGRLAQWRCAPTFESSNQYIAGAPLVNAEGALVSLVTAKRGNHYAVSTFEGEGGYFTTTETWKTITVPEGHLVYGDKTFPTREELRDYIASLDSSPAPGAMTPVLVKAQKPRIALVASNGVQVAHIYLQGVVADGVQYL